MEELDRFAQEKAADVSCGEAFSADVAAEILAARSYLYSLGQAVLGGEPAGWIDRLDEELLGQALELCGDAGGGETAGRLCRLALEANATDKLAPLYTRLFIGPNELAAAPWESVWRSKSRALFQHTTLDVRNAYREQGLLPQGYPRVADDHIALELGFLAALAARASEAAQAGDSTAAHDALEASRRFLAEHVLVWIDDYAAGLEDAAPGSFYSMVAKVFAALAQRDAELIPQLAERL